MLVLPSLSLPYEGSGIYNVDIDRDSYENKLMNVVIPKLNTKTIVQMDILIGIINDSKFNINDFTYEFYTNPFIILIIINIICSRTFPKCTIWNIYTI